MNVNSPQIQSILRLALKEDCSRDDVTSRFSIPKNLKVKGRIILKEDAIVCGMDLVKAVFRIQDKKIIFKALFADGRKCRKSVCVAQFYGNARAILSAERTALNFLGHLSGISTLTRAFVDAVYPCKTKIFDTRKTTPGLRVLEKYAVACGGGANHRFSLNDMALVKDNHRAVFKSAKSLVDAIKRIKRKAGRKIEVEVDDISELSYIVSARPDLILLDNMGPSKIRKAISVVRRNPWGKKILLEASGGVNLKNVKALARTGIDRISVGALTHSVKSIDYSLEIVS